MVRPDRGKSPLSSNHGLQYAEGVAADGLYDPAYEHDACGVGCLAHIRGRKSHALVDDALLLLRNLQHRGACGCDQDTGDGAGILLQLPDNFFRGQAQRHGIRLPAAGAYAAALVFLPDDADERQRCETALERIVSQEGQALLGWRQVPGDSSVIGWLARSAGAGDEGNSLHRPRIPNVADDEEPSKARPLLDSPPRLQSGRPTESGLAHPLTCVASAPNRQPHCSSTKGCSNDQLSRYFPRPPGSTLESALAVDSIAATTRIRCTQWALAHPSIFSHTMEEINTLKGNIYWLQPAGCTVGQRPSSARRPGVSAVALKFIGLSDSAILDQAVGLLTRNGRSLPHALMMLVPEAYESQHGLESARDALPIYRYQLPEAEPWDGPASLVFTDGTQVSAHARSQRRTS